MGEVAGVTFWALRPREWDADGRGCDEAPEGPGSGPGGVSLCGEVNGVLRGVVGWDVCPPANRASRLLRICRTQKNPFIYTQKSLYPGRGHGSGAYPVITGSTKEQVRQFKPPSKSEHFETWEETKETRKTRKKGETATNIKILSHYKINEYIKVRKYIWNK